MWQELKYSKNQVDMAGKRIINQDLDTEIRKKDLLTIDNWRASHAYPMHAIYNTLKKKLKSHKNIVLAQRLKRLDTILNKLKRFPDMNLSRMQDLGGCRVIFPNLQELKIFKDSLVRSKMNHLLVNEKNYIKTPNSDTGYRGYHLIYKYNSDKMPQYNGLLIEIQLRTKLQHLWATAVETVGMFTQNGLKFNQGEKIWLRFFQLASMIFAAEEHQKRIRTLTGVKRHQTILQEFLDLTENYDLLNKLYAFGALTSNLTKSFKNKSGYYLLQLNTKEKQLYIEYFKDTEEQIDKAIQAYMKIESTKKRSIDVVLVATKSLNALKKAYPNYFADIHDFRNKIVKYMRNQLEKCKVTINKAKLKME